jgi:hypothetical protein
MDPQINSLIRKQHLLLILAFLQLNIYSQDDQQVMDKKELKALEKEKRDAEKKEIEENEKKNVAFMIENHRFVLEANYLSGRSGANIPVNSTLNFIAIDSAKGVIQLANSWGMGSNGLGGITVDGTVTRYKVTKKENKRGANYTVMMSLMTSLGMYDICVWSSQNGYADATITGLSRGSLKYSGKLELLGVSRVYKGHSYP